jgi:hypothetical protein
MDMGSNPRKYFSGHANGLLTFFLQFLQKLIEKQPKTVKEKPQKNQGAHTKKAHLIPRIKKQILIE